MHTDEQIFTYLAQLDLRSISRNSYMFMKCLLSYMTRKWQNVW